MEASLTRAKLYHVPHWPAGHVITIECKRDPCKCAVPDLDESKGQKSRMVLLDSHTDR